MFGCVHFRAHWKFFWASAYIRRRQFALGLGRRAISEIGNRLSNALAYAMLLIHQRQARNLLEQQKLQQLFLAFLAGGITAEQYERSFEAA